MIIFKEIFGQGDIQYKVEYRKHNGYVVTQLICTGWEYVISFRAKARARKYAKGKLPAPPVPPKKEAAPIARRPVLTEEERKRRRTEGRRKANAEKLKAIEEDRKAYEEKLRAARIAKGLPPDPNALNGYEGRALEYLALMRAKHGDDWKPQRWVPEPIKEESKGALDET